MSYNEFLEVLFESGIYGEAARDIAHYNMWLQLNWVRLERLFALSGDDCWEVWSIEQWSKEKLTYLASLN